MTAHILDDRETVASGAVHDRRQYHMQNLTGRTPVRLFTAAVLAIFALTTAFMSSGGAADAPSADPVKYLIAPTVDKRVNLSVKNGSIKTDNGWVSILDNKGSKVWTMPLSYSLENLQFPIKVVKSSKTAVSLKPVTYLALAKPADAKSVAAARTMAFDYAKKQNPESAGYRTKKERDDAALNRFQSEVGAGMTITSVIFAAIGVVVGVALIGVVGCATIVACVPALAAGVTLGGIAGTVLGGGGSVVVAGMRYFQTITAPFTPPATKKKKN